MSKTTLLKCLLQVFRKKHEKRKQQHNDSTDDSEYPPDLERRYRITKKILGNGSFATVKECIHRQTGQPYALKIIQKSAIEGKFWV